jgi:GT2 family glycosyltransferase
MVPAGRQPSVRVVVVDHDGAAMTMACLEALVATDWPFDRLSIVLVDNGSALPVATAVGDRWPQVTVLRSADNLGFAAGCNLGITGAPGGLAATDYVALLNNDVTVPPSWLAPLVGALEAAPDVGAACPKVLLAGTYHDVVLRAPLRRAGPLDRRRVGVRYGGLRTEAGDAVAGVQLGDGFLGPERRRAGGPEFQWTRAEARLVVPDVAGAASVAARLGVDEPIAVVAASGGIAARIDVRRGDDWYSVPLRGAAVDVVNNAGTVPDGAGYWSDRGWLEVDAGQLDVPTDIPAWSGGAVVLRREYLEDAGLFDDRLFLYYEDVELSRRGAGKGWRYRCEPASVVRHRHSATAVAGSALADHYKERNRLLVVLRHDGVLVAVLAVARYLAATASYAYRDVVARLGAGHRPDFTAVRRRLGSLRAFFRLAPAMLRSRRADRHRIGRRSHRGR